MYALCDLLSSVSSVYMLGNNNLRIDFKLKTPPEKIDFFVQALHVEVLDTGKSYPMILLPSKQFTNSLSLNIENLARENVQEVFIFRIKDDKQEGLGFKISRATN